VAVARGSSALRHVRLHETTAQRQVAMQTANIKIEMQTANGLQKTKNNPKEL
jgi:hypothetical protein